MTSLRVNKLAIKYRMNDAMEGQAKVLRAHAMQRANINTLHLILRKSPKAGPEHSEQYPGPKLLS
jgi:hypothetical protein